MIWTVTGVTEHEYIRGGPFWVSLPHSPGAHPSFLASRTATMSDPTTPSSVRSTVSTISSFY